MDWQNSNGSRSLLNLMPSFAMSMAEAKLLIPNCFFFLSGNTCGNCVRMIQLHLVTMLIFALGEWRVSLQVTRSNKRVKVVTAAKPSSPLNSRSGQRRKLAMIASSSPPPLSYKISCSPPASLQKGQLCTSSPRTL